MDELEIFNTMPEQETVNLDIPGDSMLWDYISKACIPGPTAKIIFIAITSQVEGKIKSEGLPYGQGKSIFAGILGSEILQKFDSFLGIEPFKTVQSNMGYTWDQHIKAVEDANVRRKLFYAMDDLQRIAGKSKSRDPYVQSWAEFFTTARPFFGVVVVTCPSIGDLAKCFRELINFEIKIPKAGVYEVQFLKSYSDYSRPLEPLKSMKYRGEGIIPRAPQWFVDWYITWRKESSFDSFIAKLKEGNKKKKTKPRATVNDIYRNLQGMGYKVTQEAVRIAARVPDLEKEYNK